MKQFYVIGNPVKHSKSPQIHQSFAQQFDLNINYEHLLVATEPDDTFEKTIKKLQKNGVTGCNITLPFKEKAFHIADKRSPRATIAGAVNTLYFDNGEIYGDNTDGAGLVADITKNMQTNIADKHILIIGAGGAVKGVLAPILDQSPASLTIINRTKEKAETLAKLAQTHYPDITIDAAGLDISVNDINHSFDIIINGSSSSVSGDVPNIDTAMFKHAALAYDMMYGDDKTAFEKFAITHGAKTTTGGFGMLIEQAAESFNLWLKQMPDTSSLLESK